VIENADLEQSTRRDQAFGEREVLGARVGIPTRVIVEKDGARSRIRDQDPKDLRGIDLATRSTAARDFPLDARPVLGIDRDDQEALDRAAHHGLSVALEDQFAAGERRCKLRRGESTCARFERGGNSSGLGGANACDLHELR